MRKKGDLDWSDEEDVRKTMRELAEAEMKVAPYGRDPLTQEPSVPPLRLLAYWRLDMPKVCLSLDEAGYEDPSLPHERRGWMFRQENNCKYSPSIVRHLESWFAENIMAEESPINLLNMHHDVRHCERLPSEIKANLLFNIQQKLYKAA